MSVLTHLLRTQLLLDSFVPETVLIDNREMDWVQHEAGEPGADGLQMGVQLLGRTVRCNMHHEAI